MTHNHDDTPGAPDRSATVPRDLGDRLQRVLIASDQSAFTHSYLRLALAEEREALERAGRVIFSQAFLAAGSAPRRSKPEELGSRYHEALSEITLLAHELGKERPAAEWFVEGQREAGYFSFALEQLADRLLEMAHTAPSPSLPDDGMLELIAVQCPEEPASMLVLRGLSVLELAVRLLDAAGMRLAGALQAAKEEGEGIDAETGRLVLCGVLYVLVGNQLRPALRALKSLDGRELASTKTAWAVGPWQALHTAAVELLEIEERLQTASWSLLAEDVATRSGAEFSLEVSEASSLLRTMAKRFFEARARLEDKALPSLSSRRHVRLRIESFGRRAQTWQRELESCLEVLGAEPETAPEAHETARWLQAELDGDLGGALAELVKWAPAPPGATAGSPGPEGQEVAP